MHDGSAESHLLAWLWGGVERVVIAVEPEMLVWDYRIGGIHLTCTGGQIPWLSAGHALRLVSFLPVVGN